MVLQERLVDLDLVQIRFIVIGEDHFILPLLLEKILLPFFEHFYGLEDLLPMSRDIHLQIILEVLISDVFEHTAVDLELLEIVLVLWQHDTSRQPQEHLALAPVMHRLVSGGFTAEELVDAAHVAAYLCGVGIDNH